MNKLEFKVLFRQFFLRVVDLELLSSEGDVQKFLGQIGGLLAGISWLFTLPSLIAGGKFRSYDEYLAAIWSTQHFLISTTMLVVGLFAVLSWDSIFPDKRDVLVLAPLPLRVHTLFLAKVAAAAAMLSISVIAVNIFTSLGWAWRWAARDSWNLGGIRPIVAYWITMFSAGIFLFGSVLAVQSLAAQILPRRLFLRFSAVLQLVAFCLFLSVYFLEPSLTTPKALTAPENQGILAWLPTYWFLGFFHQLNGSMHPALVPLARRAWIGLFLAVFGTGATLLLAYYRTLKKIVEEPDIIPGSRRAGWSPRFGSSLPTAIVLFAGRTLFRSRQHRMIFAFYLGIGFAIALFYMKTPLGRRHFFDLSAGSPWHQVNASLLVASIMMMIFAAVGARVVFSLPLTLRANWIFRITENRKTEEYFIGIRRSVLSAAVIPIWMAFAALFLLLWPIQSATGHLIALGLVGMILVDLCLLGFEKIPFTCSYLPGKTNIQVVFWIGVLVLVPLLDKAAQYEQLALHNVLGYLVLLALLGAIAGTLRWRSITRLKAGETSLHFEELPPAEIIPLGLHKDGILCGPMEHKECYSGTYDAARGALNSESLAGNRGSL